MGHIAGHQFYNNHNNYYSPAGVGVATGHVLGYHGDSRSSLDRLEAEGSPATVDVAKLLRQGHEVSSTSREMNSSAIVQWSVSVLDNADVLSLF